MDEVLRLELDHTLEDWRVFVDHTTGMARAAAKDGLRTTSRLIGVGGVLLGLAVGLLDHSRLIDVRLLLVLIGVLLVVWIGAILLGKRWRRFALAALEPRPGGAFLGRSSVTLDERGMRFAGPQSEASMGWGLVRDIHETDTHVYVMVDTSSAIILPKRCLSPHAAGDVVNFIARRRAAAGRAIRARDTGAS